MTGKRGTQKSSLVVGGEPRVELMPPEVAQRERMRSMRNLGIVVLIASILVVAGGYGLATTLNTGAQQGLADAQGETARILAEQQEYNGVTTVSALIAAIEDAEGVARSTEVNWVYVASEMGRVVPPTVLFSSLNVAGRAPWEPELETAGELRQAKVAVLTMTVLAPSLNDLTSAVRALETLDIVADASLDSATAGAGYEGKVTVNLSDKALTVNVPEATPTPTSTPTPTPTPSGQPETGTDEEVAP